MGMPTMRWAPAALAGSVVAGAALAACGTQQAVTASGASQPARPVTSAPASPAQGGALCSDTSAVTRLVVTRVGLLPQNHLHFAAPAGVTIRDPATARTVARAICALPAAPHAVTFCPADFGVSYRLSFAAGREAFPVVKVTAGGCGRVSGAGPTTRATSNAFWIGLARALGVSHPSSSALQGTS